MKSMMMFNVPDVETAMKIAEQIEAISNCYIESFTVTDDGIAQFWFSEYPTQEEVTTAELTYVDDENDEFPSDEYTEYSDYPWWDEDD